MRRLILLALVSAAGLLAADGTQLSQAQIDQIIAKFAAKETEFAKARDNYTYRQSVKLLELDQAGGTIGNWEMVSDIIFTPDGTRTEKVVYAPVPHLVNILLSPEDMQDLRDVQPFVLTTADIDKYLVRYLGQQNLDGDYHPTLAAGVSCYVFAAKPKKMEPGQRYFEGEIWVDTKDLQIIKTYGRGVGLLKRGSDQAFPKFETLRQQIDGKYWFPVYTIARDTLNFESGLSQPIQMTVRYDDYKQFKSNVTIQYGDEATTPPTTTPTKPPVIKK